MHHFKAESDRLYMPRSIGDLDMTQLEISFTTSTNGIPKFLNLAKIWMFQPVEEHESSKRLHSIIEQARKFKHEPGVDEPINHDETSNGTKTV